VKGVTRIWAASWPWVFALVVALVGTGRPALAAEVGTGTGASAARVVLLTTYIVSPARLAKLQAAARGYADRARRYAAGLTRIA